MAKQKGPLQLEGRLGNLSFYTDKNGNSCVRTAGGPSAEKVKTDPNFENFRRAGSEFGMASSASKMIRQLLAPYTKYCSEGTVCNRMNKCMQTVLRTDKNHGHARGQRQVSNGKVELLEGFQWNSKLAVEDALKTDAAGFIEPSSGKMHLILSSFVPDEMTRPEGAGFFQILALGAGMNPEIPVHKRRPGEHLRVIEQTEIMPISKDKTGTITMDLELEVKDSSILVLGLGVKFFEPVNGEILPLHGGAFGLLRVVKTQQEAKVSEAGAGQPQTTEHETKITTTIPAAAVAAEKPAEAITLSKTNSEDIAEKTPDEPKKGRKTKVTPAADEMPVQTKAYKKTNTEAEERPAETKVHKKPKAGPEDEEAPIKAKERKKPKVAQEAEEPAAEIKPAQMSLF